MSTQTGKEITEARFVPEGIAHPPPAIIASPSDPMALLVNAAVNGMDIDKLRALMEMKKEMMAMEARQAYVRAMADFKANPPRIFKDKQVSFGTGKTSYAHARLGEIVRSVTAALSEHGLSLAWSLAQSPGLAKVTCTVTHQQGHQESVSMEAPLDTSGSKNAIQAIGSTKTYLERYTLMAICGLAAEDDDDGQGAADAEERRRNVGQYREPGERREETRDDAPADDFAWREFYPDRWKDAIVAGKVLGEMKDADIGMLWKKNVTDPKLCGWAMHYVATTVNTLKLDWLDIQKKVPGTPDNPDDCNPANLWALAAYVRNARAKKEGGAQ